MSQPRRRWLSSFPVFNPATLSPPGLAPTRTGCPVCGGGGSPAGSGRIHADTTLDTYPGWPARQVDSSPAYTLRPERGCIAVVACNRHTGTVIAPKYPVLLCTLLPRGPSATQRPGVRCWIVGGGETITIIIIIYLFSLILIMMYVCRLWRRTF